MASSGEVEVTAEVQAYLDKHRISNLFQVRGEGTREGIPAMNAVYTESSRSLPSCSSSVMYEDGITAASQ